MSLTADHDFFSGRAMSWRAKIIALAIGLPALAYAPGLVMALPYGVATSFPFWASAPDYTCSSLQARSLMVRVAPYSSFSNAVDYAPPKPKVSGWDCARIESFKAADLGVNGDAPDASKIYVRVFTPSQAKKAQLPPIPVPSDMSSTFVKLEHAPRNLAGGEVAAANPAIKSITAAAAEQAFTPATPRWKGPGEATN